jgi:DNA-binding transcriptional LysR family regulator
MADIHLLRSFLTVYRAGTFTRAAHELHLTQPAVSLHIKSLESQLGKRLFRRAARGVTPTAAGRELAQAVGPHLDALEGVVDHVQGGSDAVGESLYIGGPEEFLSMRVLPELVDFMDDGMRVRMHFDVNQPIMDRLTAGELDLAVFTADLRQRGVETQPFGYELLELVAAPIWRDWLGEVQEGSAGAARLTDIPIATYDEDLPLVQLYWQSVFNTRAQMRASLVANSLRAALMFARNGAGITVLPSHTCSEAIAHGDIVPLLTPHEPPRSRLFLAWRSGALRRSSLARVHEHLTRVSQAW